jgi:hypothetical protein
MKFTLKSYFVPIICGTLIITTAGQNKAINRIGPSLPPTVAVQDNSPTPGTFTTNGDVQIMPAVERIPLASVQAAVADDFSTVAWYKNKHWWKRNAPIIGGAAGGGLIGGLAGGGKGFIIGGAAGAGGGALYKHYRNHHTHPHDTQYRTTPTPNHSKPSRVRR